jgi:predicted GIY-YIG superfamily endonuclease
MAAMPSRDDDDLDTQAMLWAASESLMQASRDRATAPRFWQGASSFRNAAELLGDVQNQSAYERSMLHDAEQLQDPDRGFPVDVAQTIGVPTIVEDLESSIVEQAQVEASLAAEMATASRNLVVRPSATADNVPCFDVVQQQRNLHRLLSLQPMRRSDPSTGVLLTVDEFVTTYGLVEGRRHWNSVSAFRVERRWADDHNLYAMHEFANYYNDNGARWRSAPLSFSTVVQSSLAKSQRGNIDTVGFAKHSNRRDGRLLIYAQFVEVFGPNALQEWMAVANFLIERRRAMDGCLYDRFEFEAHYNDAGVHWGRALTSVSSCCRYSDGVGMKATYLLVQNDPGRNDGNVESLWLEGPPYLQNFYVYLLVANDNTNYIGSTTELKRRIQEHIGKRSGGAKLTSKHSGWRIAVYVSGFASYDAAHKFESAWHAPETTRHLTAIQQGMPRQPLHRRKLAENLTVLSMLLNSFRPKADYIVDIGHFLNMELCLPRLALMDATMCERFVTDFLVTVNG